MLQKQLSYLKEMQNTITIKCSANISDHNLSPYKTTNATFSQNNLMLNKIE